MTRAPRKHRNVGRRIRVGPISHYGKKVSGLEGTLIEKTSDPAWPFHITLDNGMELALDDWQFEFIGTAVETLQPPRVIPKPERVKSEVEKTTMAKVALKTRPASKGKATSRKPASERINPERSTKNARAKTAARSTARERVPAKAATKAASKPAAKKGKGWGTILLDLMKAAPKATIKLLDFYDANEAKLAKMFPDNNNVRSTIRQQLQSMQRNGLVDSDKPGTWFVTKAGAKA